MSTFAITLLVLYIDYSTQKNQTFIIFVRFLTAIFKNLNYHRASGKNHETFYARSLHPFIILII